jgi:hypothetical protein
MSISAALLTALYPAIEKKFAGAAAEYLIDAAKHAAQRFEGLLHGDAEKQAQALVAHVLAEAAAYPPTTAVRVEVLSTVDIVGIWPPRGDLALNLLWVNRADFPIRIRDVKVNARAGGPHDHWEINQGDEFVLRPRSDTTRTLRGAPSMVLPRFDRGGGSCDVTVNALVSGPWEDSAQRSHELYSGGLWIPAHVEQADLLTDTADIDIAIETFFTENLARNQHKHTIRFSDFDKERGLRPGASSERFEIVAKANGHEFKPGTSVGALRLVRPQSAPRQPSSFWKRGSSRMDGW